MKENVKLTTTELARTVKDEGIDNVVLQMLDICGSDMMSTTCFFMLSRYVMDCPRLSWNKIYNDFEEADKKFREYASAFDETSYEDEYAEIKALAEDDDDEPYTSSSSDGDYSPSAPWNAPGMNVSDFIRGVR